ncbi:MAG: hypothetical protein CMP22_01990 [Rickettsiales bacterium]|nr:hypothetical protein [Rickettsiales bacterium]|tara:strand:+ start:2203 stop:2781 length:579 start_codon:yes stop_codon:yes gene_type:complete
MAIDSTLMLLGVIVCLLILTAVCGGGFYVLKKAVDRQALFERRRHRILVGREKAVLAASLIGEIHENKNKCEAFVTIYSEMLRNLRDDTRKPAYQQTGDFVHKAPSLSRAVYDNNISNLNLFEPSLATKVSEVYAMIETDPEYLSLEPDMPLDTAIRMVEMIVKNAETISETVDKVVPSLEVVVRNAPRVSV